MAFDWSLLSILRSFSECGSWARMAGTDTAQPPVFVSMGARSFFGTAKLVLATAQMVPMAWRATMVPLGTQVMTVVQPVPTVLGAPAASATVPKEVLGQTLSVAVAPVPMAATVVRLVGEPSKAAAMEILPSPLEQVMAGRGLAFAPSAKMARMGTMAVKGLRAHQLAQT